MYPQGSIHSLLPQGSTAPPAQGHLLPFKKKVLLEATRATQVLNRPGLVVDQQAASAGFVHSALLELERVTGITISNIDGQIQIRSHKRNMIIMSLLLPIGAIPHTSMSFLCTNWPGSAEMILGAAPSLVNEEIGWAGLSKQVVKHCAQCKSRCRYSAFRGSLRRGSNWLNSSKAMCIFPLKDGFDLHNSMDLMVTNGARLTKVCRTQKIYIMCIAWDLKINSKLYPGEPGCDGASCRSTDLAKERTRTLSFFIFFLASCLLSTGPLFALDYSSLSFSPAQLRTTQSTPFLILTCVFDVSFFYSTLPVHSFNSYTFFSSVSVSSYHYIHFSAWIFSLPCSSLLFSLLFIPFLYFTPLSSHHRFPWPSFLLKSSIFVTQSFVLWDAKNEPQSQRTRCPPRSNQLLRWHRHSTAMCKAVVQNPLHRTTRMAAATTNIHAAIPLRSAQGCERQKTTCTAAARSNIRKYAPMQFATTEFPNTKTLIALIAQENNSKPMKPQFHRTVTRPWSKPWSEDDPTPFRSITVEDAKTKQFWETSFTNLTILKANHFSWHAHLLTSLSYDILFSWHFFLLISFSWHHFLPTLSLGIHLLAFFLLTSDISFS